MYFESLNAAWEMAGHGPFVWAAYGITLLVIAGLILIPHQRAREAEIALRAEREQEGCSDAVARDAGDTDAS
jgi:heme exporter protein D